MSQKAIEATEQKIKEMEKEEKLPKFDKESFELYEEK